MVRNYLTITAGGQTQKQKQQMPLLRTGPKQGDLLTLTVSDFSVLEPK